MGIRRLRMMAATTAAISALALAGLSGAPALAAATPGTATPPTPGASTAAPPPTTTAKQTHTGSPKSQPACSTAPKPGQVTCFALKRTDISAVKGVMRGKNDKPSSNPADGNTNAPAGYGPADLVSAYNLPANAGAGATIAIVDAQDDPNAEADLAVYRAQYGLPACTTANGCFRKVDENGGTNYPAPNSGWAGEISLDLDMVSAVAPNAHILLVEATSANNRDLGASVNEAVALGAKYVSNSYGSQYSASPGTGEDPSETAYDAYYNHPGVAVVASSGDSAYGVAYPAASPYVTSVGGTALTRDPNTSRGWSESVWKTGTAEGGGSGCSLYETKPAWQTDTGCAQRTVADVSAVADPATGLAVYQTYGGGGWTVYGGTSASSPIIAGVYADAGTPAPGTSPSSYPYNDRSALNDVTTGSNGTCSPTYLCTAGTGYDGPTGLGTPNGTAAFRTGASGEIKGVITDAATAKPLAGATVTVGGVTATTGADGGYDIGLPPGSYGLTVGAYGYGTQTIPALQVTDGGVVTENFALQTVARTTVTGKVTDSGHGYPLYAAVSIAGVPGAPVHTDPKTGAYSLQLPVNGSYTLDVTSSYAGYQAVQQKVTTGSSSGQTVDVKVPVDPASCTAAGYQRNLHGVWQTFDSTTTPPGWTVTNAPGTTSGWEFDHPTNYGNSTGGSGNYAVADSRYYGAGKTQDSYLTTPAVDMTRYTVANPPVLQFQSSYAPRVTSTASVELSTDGGATWSVIYTQRQVSTYNNAISLPLQQAAGASAVQVRFHYTGGNSLYWELDNVLLGSPTCDAVPGGLVVGTVTDRNTGDALVGAKVVDSADSAVQATTAMLDDPAVHGGFYSVFSPDLGVRTLNVSDGHYTTATAGVTVQNGATAKADASLAAGRVVIHQVSLSKTMPWGGTNQGTLTLKNTGTADATVNLSDIQSGQFTAQGINAGASGPVPAVSVSGYFPTGDEKQAARNETAAQKAQAAQTQAQLKALDESPSASGWTAIADYPTKISDNMTETLGGILYSGFGYTGTDDTNALYAYDPTDQQWTALASAQDSREGPAHGVMDGKIYVVGGWNPNGNPDPKVEVYDPVANSWSTRANAPMAYAGSTSAVLDGKLYVIGGCSSTDCGSHAAYSYAPSTDSWTKLADYPEALGWSACGAISGKLYCAGGVNSGTGPSSGAYVYDPALNTWSPIASLAGRTWGAAYTAANGRLLVQDGNVNGSLSNRGYAYDPATNSWSQLPNTPTASGRFGGALGFYTVGGSIGAGFAAATAQVLPGWDQTGAARPDWLSLSSSSVTLAPGRSTTVTVALDAAAASIVQPGTYRATVQPTADTPYRMTQVPVSMAVAPAATWGKLSGVVRYQDSAGTHPLAGATVTITTSAASYTLRTDTTGAYQRWLDARDNPLTVTVSKDGYATQQATVDLTKGSAVVKDWTLVPS
ncbi:carboxypeptidase regulatory-like domain-containing protein [Streptomyces sp. NPDC020917]|uniref:carboxypeptidase regulatory-like domain-containing protein n=1 Tax=Streptomyces sp. NPDC020917 TaxID=3365102 RepID=UPI0037AF31BC